MKFGVEIEVTSDIDLERAEYEIAMSGVDVKNLGYSHRTTPFWKLVSDGSCGFEAVSPVLDSHNARVWDEISDVTLGLLDAGASVDDRCGLHVHLDASGLLSAPDSGMRVLRNFCALYLKLERYFDLAMPASRRGSANEYCRSAIDTYGANDYSGRYEREPAESDAEYLGRLNQALRRIDQARTHADLIDALTWRCSRYYKLNLFALYEHSTIEVRHHEGTLDSRAIVNWVRLLQSLFRRAMSIRGTRLARYVGERGAEYLLRHLDDQDAVAFLRTKFAAQSARNGRPDRQRAAADPELASGSSAGLSADYPDCTDEEYERAERILRARFAADLARLHALHARLEAISPEQAPIP